jgi:3-oxoacyl-[acyl-carrier protein] reductase
MLLEGRRTLITGASSGIGKATAERFGAEGASVCVNYYSDKEKPSADAVCAGIDPAGKRAFSFQADVGDEAQVTAMMAAVVERFGGIDVLVNNAGNAGPTDNAMAAAPPFWETGPKDWEPWLGTNLHGVLHATRAVLPGMVERGYGRVVSVISDAGRVGEPNLVVYGGAKAGAAGFSRGLAKAVGRHGITVNCVALSSVNTPGVAAAVADGEAVKRMLSHYVIRRLGEPSDAANMVLFLASDAASWITGQTYPVNGGYSFAV